MPLLSVENLRIAFHSRDRVVEAVRGISFALEAGRTLAIVGESGSGKSVTALSLTRLLPDPPACRVTGAIRYQDRDVLGLGRRELQALRGKEIAYVFQEPSSSLNPVFTVGAQIAEAVRLHVPDVPDLRAHVVQALAQVGIDAPDRRYDAYPHELSGGMQQRVMIAMALACRPRILVADEPTTALDVTIQKQIIDLLRELRVSAGMGVILITHNFGIVQGFADEVAVMYRGKIVEQGPTEEVLRHPRHPYTRALIACIPRLGAGQRRLATIDHDAIAREVAAAQA
jgi:ABC-type dipeptide/oligopeptide/nickel transport system ATPase component